MSKIGFKNVLLTALIISPAIAFAQTSNGSEKANSSTLKVEDVQKSQEKKKDIDEEITDARLRVTLGSKSKISFQSSLSYAGGSVKDPLNSVRPNYRAAATIETMTSLSGNVGLNYRIGDRDSLTFGTGISVIDPLHGDLTKPAEDVRSGMSGTMARYQVSTPYLGWTRGYRAFDTQMVTGASYSHATDSDSINKTKTLGAVSLSQTVLANMGTSKWSGGASLGLSKDLYSGDITNSTLVARMKAGQYKRSDLSVALSPFMQYAFNDRYSFRTVFGYFQFARYEGSNDNIQIEPYQSIGTGISITRDIYLYPNIQFTPKDIRADRTNVGLSANINLF